MELIKNKQILFLSFALSIFLILIVNNILFGAIGLLIVLLIYIYGERFLLAVIIISLFTLVGDISKTLRTFVQVFDLGLLGIIFLKRFKFQFTTYPPIPKYLLYFLLLYYSSMIISSTFSNYPFAGIELIIRQTIFFAIAYIFYALIKDEKDIKNYLIAFLIATCILAASSIFSFVIGDSFMLASGSRERFSGLISNPDTATAFYMISFPLVLSVLLLKKGTTKKTLGLFILGCFIIALFLTISRSAIIGVLTSTIIIFYLLRKKYFNWTVFFFGALVLIVFIYEPLREMVLVLFRIENGVSGRDHLWSISINMIKDHPVFGIGPGAYRHEMFNYFPVMMNSWMGKVLKDLYEMTNGSNLSHNFFLFFTSEMGILGFLTSLSLQIIFFRTGFQLLKKYNSKRKDLYYLIVALLAAGLSMFIRAIVDSIGLLYYGAITADLPFWLLFGILIFFNRWKPEYFAKEII